MFREVKFLQCFNRCALQPKKKKKKSIVFPLEVDDKILLMLSARLIQSPISWERERQCRTRLCPRQYICAVAIPTHFEVVENALPEALDAEDSERAQAVNTAVQWINQSITEELWGLVPSNQAEVDHRLRYSFHFKIIMASYKRLSCLHVPLWSRVTQATHRPDLPKKSEIAYTCAQACKGQSPTPAVFLGCPPPCILRQGILI